MPHFGAHNVGPTVIGAHGVCAHDDSVPVVGAYGVGACYAGTHDFGSRL